MPRSDIEQAELYGRRRANLLPVLAVLLIVQQGAFITGGGGHGSEPLITGLVWMGVTSVLILIAAGQWLFVRKSVRALLDDEGTMALRRQANSLGFINAMVTAVLLYALTFVKAFSAREAIVVMVAVGLSSALLSLGMWERQALKDG